MARKFRLAVLISLLMVAIIASQVLAAPSIRFTLNGAKERFNAGAVLMLYGRTEDSGMALPDADVFIKVVCGDNQIYWSQTRSDYNGYFGTNFNLPVNASGNMSVSITALDKIETKSYELGVAESGLVFNNIGFTDKIVNQRVRLLLMKYYWPLIAMLIILKITQPMQILNLWEEMRETQIV